MSVVSSDSQACLEVFNLLLLLSSGGSGPGEGGSIVGGNGDDVRSVRACSLDPLKKENKPSYTCQQALI